MKTVLTCIAFLLLSFQLRADHVLGSQITYKQVDSSTFDIYITYFRNCNSTALINVSSNSKIKCLAGGSEALNCVLQSIEEIPSLVDTLQNQCNPPNSNATGKGIEKHIYKARVDFNQMPYTNFGTCCKFIVETTAYNRSSAITTGVSGALYNYAEFNRCLDQPNSSPYSSFDPLLTFCCNEPVFLTFNCKDDDGDSLSYNWANPKSDYNTNLSYSGAYLAYNNPFTAYFPGSLTPPTAYPNANPPIGLTMYKLLGELVFTPTNCNQVTVAVVEVLEWRKDAAGVYQNIGRIRIDQQYNIVNCEENNPPELDGPYSYSVCKGETLCFDITTDDQVFVPPPPGTVPPRDSTTLRWDSGIANASFTILKKDTLNQTARFCWTPDSSTDTRPFYTFVAEVRDNNSPRNSIARRTYAITVKENAKAVVSLDTLACGWFKLNADAGSYGLERSKWIVLDSAYNPISDTSIVLFASSGRVSGSGAQDSLAFLKPGNYFIQFDPETVNAVCKNLPRITMVINQDLVYSQLEVPQIERQGNKLRTKNLIYSEWYRNDTLIGSGFEIDAQIPGVYTARNCKNGCCSDFSDEMTIGTNSIIDFYGSFKVFPNPSYGTVTVEFDQANTAEEAEVAVYTISGKQIELTPTIVGKQMIFILPEQSGIYYLEIKTEKGIEVISLVKL